MGEAKRRRDQAEDLGRVIFRSPDLSLWGTPEGLAEKMGLPPSDPQIVATSRLLQTVWAEADGMACGDILSSIYGLLGVVFRQMAGGDREVELNLACVFAEGLTEMIVRRPSDAEMEERVRQRRAQAKPKH